MATNPTNEYHDDGHQSFLEKILFPVGAVNKQKLAAGISKKTILITGASYGIGAALTNYLSYYPVTLLLLARTGEKLEELKQSLRDRPAAIKNYTVDLRNETDIEAFLLQLKNENIPIHFFINNAGKSIHRGLKNSLTRFHDTSRSVATNLTGPVKLLLGIAEPLIANKGHIINISAVNVLLPPAVGWSAYQASKSGYDQWLRSTEPEWNAMQVKVSSIYLPLVRTRMSMVNPAKKKQPAMSKEKAVCIILRSLYTQKRKYTPWWLGMVNFANTLMPNLFYCIQLKSAKKES
jgi:short-subunit dehydrogenase